VLLVQASRDALEIEDTRCALMFLMRTTLELQMLCDGGLGAVLAASTNADEQTSLAKEEVVKNTHELLDRAHRDKVVRRDVKAEDLRNLMCGLEHAIRVESGGFAERADRYLVILVEGLRPADA
jgi:hypothetical protein